MIPLVVQVQHAYQKSPCMNYAEAGKALGCSRNYIGMIIKGIRKPSTKFLQKLANLSGYEFTIIITPEKK